MCAICEEELLERERLCLTAGVSGFQDAVDVLAAFVAERDPRSEPPAVDLQQFL